MQRIEAVKDDATALGALLPTLQNPRDRQWVAAWVSCASVGDKVDVLGRMATSDPDTGVRAHAAAFLSDHISPAARPFVRDCLASSEYMLQRGALVYVLRDPHPDFRVDVERCVRHWSPRIRRRAARALGRIGDPQSAERLREACRDRDLLVRWHAWRALRAVRST